MIIVWAASCRPHAMPLARRQRRSQAGTYFVTVVTHGRELLFGEIVGGEMRLNRYGKIVRKWWDDIPVHFPNIETGTFVVMPNHVHGIIVITDNGGRGEVLSPRLQDGKFLGGETPEEGGETPPLQKSTLGQIMAYFKYQVTKEINTIEDGPVTKLWQRNYYEHVIRNWHEMENIWNYIESNPAQWEDDDENSTRCH